MSDIKAFQPHHVLQHRTLEAVVFQWDGTQEQALQVTAELERELPMRDAALEGAKFHGGASVKMSRSTQSVEVDDRRSLSLRIVRKADGLVNAISLRPHEWLVIWLHEDRLYATEIFSRERGEIMFRPVRPIVIMRPRVES